MKKIKLKDEVDIQLLLDYGFLKDERFIFPVKMRRDNILINIDEPYKNGTHAKAWDTHYRVFVLTDDRLISETTNLDFVITHIQDLINNKLTEIIQ